MEHPDAVLYALHEEYGFLDVGACAGRRPEVGDVTIIPNHACGCASLHDRVAVHRGGEVIAPWDVAARGELR